MTLDASCSVPFCRHKVRQSGGKMTVWVDVDDEGVMGDKGQEQGLVQ